MEQFSVLLPMYCLNLFVCNSFSTSAKIKTILQNCWSEKMCSYSDCSSWNKREILFYWCLGIKGIGHFAGHIVAHMQSFTSKWWKHKTNCWDPKPTSLHFENVFLAMCGSSVRVWSTCVCASLALSSASPKINTGPKIPIYSSLGLGCCAIWIKVEDIWLL